MGHCLLLLSVKSLTVIGPAVAGGYWCITILCWYVGQPVHGITPHIAKRVCQPAFADGSERWLESPERTSRETISDEKRKQIMHLMLIIDLISQISSSVCTSVNATIGSPPSQVTSLGKLHHHHPPVSRLLGFLFSYKKPRDMKDCMAHAVTNGSSKNQIRAWNVRRQGVIHPASKPFGTSART